MKSGKWKMWLLLLAAVILVAGSGMRAKALEDPNLAYDCDNVHDGTVGEYYEAYVYCYAYREQLVRAWLYEMDGDGNVFPDGIYVNCEPDLNRICIKGTPEEEGTFSFLLELEGNDCLEETPTMTITIAPAGSKFYPTLTNCYGKHQDGTSGGGFKAGELVTLYPDNLSKSNYVYGWASNGLLDIPTGIPGDTRYPYPANSFYMPASNDVTITALIQDKDLGTKYHESYSSMGADDTCGPQLIESMLFALDYADMDYTVQEAVIEDRQNRGLINYFYIDLDKDGNDDLLMTYPHGERMKKGFGGYACAIQALEDRNVYGVYTLEVPANYIYNNSSRGHYSTINIDLGPDFKASKNPSSASTVVGGTGSFTAAASGSGLKYQWQFRTGAAGVWNNCTSATTGYNKATLKVTGATYRNGYQYRCAITDGSNRKTFTKAATLYVLKKQPANVSTTANKTASFTAAGYGTGLTYQWQWRKSSSDTWKDCTSATTGYNKATLKVTATAARNGYQYRCKITDSNDKLSISKAVSLYVLKKQPVSVSKKEGTTASFTVAAYGSGLTYQWQWRKSSSDTWTNCTSATEGYNKATLKVAATIARNGYQYRCRIKDSSGKTVFSAAATLNVLGIKTQPSSVTVAAGNQATFKVVAVGKGLTYQWQWRKNSSSAWNDCTSATEGYNTATLKVTATAARNGYQYRCVVSDSAGNSVNSNSAKLTVK